MGMKDNHYPCEQQNDRRVLGHSPQTNQKTVQIHQESNYARTIAAQVSAAFPRGVPRLEFALAMTMSPAHSLTYKLLWCGGLLLVMSPLWLAQLAAQPGNDPFGGGGAPPAARPKSDDPPADVIPQAEPLVLQQIRESNPIAADQLIEAAAAVLRYGRPDECKRYLTKFLAGKFPEDDLAALPAKHGSAFFLELSTHDKLQPEGAQVATQVLTAARKAAENPARLQALVKELSSTNYEAASTALTRLEQAGPNLVAPVLQALVDPSRTAEHRRLLDALIELSETTTPPLISTLAAAPEPQQIIAAKVLGEVRAIEAVRHLVAPAHAAGVSPALRTAARDALTKIMGGVPREHESELYLLRQFSQLREGQHPFKPDGDNNTVVWQWDAATKGPKSSILPLQDAIRQLSARLATDLHRLGPQNREYQKLRLLHYLEFAKAIGGLSFPLPANSPAFVLAKEAGPEMTAEVLAMAMKERLHAAAIAATEVLGVIGTAELITADSPAPGVLSTALTHADRRIRIAAALTIVKLRPQVSFPGASHVVEVLGDAVRTAGVDRVLVVDGRADVAQTIAGLLADQGYYGDAAISSREAFRKATTAADYELILISDVLDVPVTEMVQLLRRDRRTAMIPIGVMAGTDTVDDLPKIFHDSTYRDPTGKIRSRSVDDVVVLLAEDRRTYVAPRPHTSETVAFMAAEVRKRGGRDLIGREERLANGRAALNAFKTLIADKELFNRYGVLRQEATLISALSNPTLLGSATETLGLLATPKAQSALVDLASQLSRPIADRQAGLAGLQVAIAKRGIQLTQQQLLTQYDRYNASESLPAETQAVLAGVLDAIESRRPAVPTSAPAKPK
jgi:CheY-like chemotaxis protein